MAKSKCPERISTGVRSTTIANPATSGVDRYSGAPSGFAWNHQRANFEKIAAILSSNGRRLTKVYASTYMGEGSYLDRAADRMNNRTPRTRALVSFVAVARDFVWHKYEGTVAGGGKNTVYVAGHQMALTDFLAMTPAKRAALFRKG